VLSQVLISTGIAVVCVALGLAEFLLSRAARPPAQPLARQSVVTDRNPRT
jgi:hypothetical protein